GEKAVLQDAAVVGKVFWAGAVAALSGRERREIRDALGRLRVKELVLRNDPPSFSDDLEFAFRHSLIRDGAYEALPKALRAQKHRQVAAWALDRAGDRADDIAELIATHHLEALRYLDELGDRSADRATTERDAYRWAKAAGDRSSAMWLAADANEWYREAARLAPVVEAPIGERARLALELVRVSWGVRSSEETEEACREAIALCEAAGDEGGAGEAEASLTMVLFQQGRNQEALEAGGQAVARLERIDESPELAEALRSLGQFHWRRGNSAESDA